MLKGSTAGHGGSDARVMCVTPPGVRGSALPSERTSARSAGRLPRTLMLLLLACVEATGCATFAPPLQTVASADVSVVVQLTTNHASST